ncbi:prion-like-(Q/N-rich) domain-bearing protein 25 [Schistocerca cancellata]|uniref:prion-like-(Q/N-rich) domain-bearing protein 25 n=1 Tax=Schistocerca cancellata TaxID=274614 RepID=UPI00211851BB|nr:prion-like-(Q/N-rich) domain-bearing protein 25 [Schistocerca cancellata]
MAHIASLFLAVGVVAVGIGFQLAQGAATCKEDSDCSALKNSICYEGQCTCPSQFFPNYDYTLCLPPSVDSSTGCEAAMQCAGRLGLGVECHNSVCRCGPGNHYLHGSCRQSAGVGEKCTESDDCFDNYATHTLTCASGVCACADGAYDRYGSCRLKARGAGDSCDYDEDCSHTDTSLSCIENVCTTSSRAAASRGMVIASAYVESREDEENIPNVIPSNLACGNSTCGNTTCYNDTQCGFGETCSVLETCACKAGFFRDSDGACKLELGESCTADADCSHIAGARCGVTDSSRSATCHCGPRWAPDPVNNFCRLARKMNYSCAENANCFSFGNAVCKDYKCACDDGFRFVEERNFCWPIKALNDECSETLDCYYSGSICSNGTCACAEGYHETYKGTCLKDIKELGDECVSYSECTSLFEHSICSGGRCVCGTGYLQTGPTVCSVGVSGQCSDNETCSAVSGAICNGKRCVCEDGFTLSAASDTCLQVATEEGGPCIESVQCEPLMGKYSTCNTTTGSCVCLAGMHFADGACWNNTVLGGSCSRSSECFVVGSRDGLECRNGFCECKFEYAATEDRSACVSGATSGLHLGASTSALLLLALCLLRSSLC